jgi:hypothetical protein
LGRRLTKLQRRRKIMRNSSEETKFIQKDGTPIRNVLELSNAMEIMSTEIYTHHVNEQRNDFSNWVRDVMDDRILSKQIQEAKDKTQTQVTILKHLVRNLS